MRAINNIYIDVTSGRVNVSRQGLASVTGARGGWGQGGFSDPLGLVSPCGVTPNKRLAFQGNGFLICEIVKESPEWGSSHSPKEAPCKEKQLEHLFKEPLEMLGGGVPGLYN